MTKQKRKFDKIIASAEDAELVDKSEGVAILAEEKEVAVPQETEKVAVPVQETTQTDEVNQARFKDAINECLNKHKEKGGMAFDILKAVTTNKMDSIVQGKNFSELVTACFSLADVFKLEMDTRWTRDVAEISRSIFGPTESQSPVEEPAPVETAEAPTTTPEVTVTGSETIN